MPAFGQAFSLEHARLSKVEPFGDWCHQDRGSKFILRLTMLVLLSNCVNAATKGFNSLFSCFPLNQPLKGYSQEPSHQSPKAVGSPQMWLSVPVGTLTCCSLESSDNVASNKHGIHIHATNIILITWAAFLGCANGFGQVGGAGGDCASVRPVARAGRSRGVAKGGEGAPEHLRYPLLDCYWVTDL